jgi:Mn2+/Fe2+ NRAMP family transporter
MGKSFKEAPVFFGIYTGMIVVGALIISVPGIPLIPIMILSQAFNGILLPFIVIMVLLLVNKKELMGKFVNSKRFNFVAWLAVVLIVALSVFLVVTTLVPSLRP